MSNTDTVASPTNPTDIEKSADGQPQRTIGELSDRELVRMLNASPNSEEAKSAATELDKRQKDEIAQRNEFYGKQELILDSEGRYIETAQDKYLRELDPNANDPAADENAEKFESLYTTSRGQILTAEQAKASGQMIKDSVAVRSRDNIDISPEKPLTSPESNALNFALSDLQSKVSKGTPINEAVEEISNYLNDEFPLLSDDERIRIAQTLKARIDARSVDPRAKVPGLPGVLSA